MVQGVIACKEKYKSRSEEQRHWSNTRKMKNRQTETHLDRGKEMKRGRTAVRPSGIGVLVCQCNVRTEMKGSLRKEAQNVGVRRIDARG